jgi:hypothetical protein
MEAVDVNLECPQEANASGHGPGMRRCSHVIVAPVIRPAPTFCLVFVLLSCCNIFLRLVMFHVSTIAGSSTLSPSAVRDYVECGLCFTWHATARVPYRNE